MRRGLVAGIAFDGEASMVYNIRKNYTHKRRADGGD